MINQEVPYMGIYAFSQESIRNSIRAAVALCERQLHLSVEKVKENICLIRVSCSANQH